MQLPRCLSSRVAASPPVHLLLYTVCFAIHGRVASVCFPVPLCSSAACLYVLMSVFLSLSAWPCHSRCLSVCRLVLVTLSVCLSVCPCYLVAVCLSVGWSLLPCRCLSVGRSLSPCRCLCICMYVLASLSLSVCLSLRVSASPERLTELF